MRPRHRGFRIGAAPRSVADAVEDAVSASEAAERVMSVSQAARMLGRDRGTLRAWQEKGMPVAKAGGSGEAILVDLKAVVEWREEQVRLEERERYAKPAAEGPDGRPMTVKDQIELEKLASLSMKNGRDAEFLVPRPHVEAAFERALGIIRISVMAVPERIVREMAGFPDDKKLVWREKALKSCRAALQEGAAALSEALPGFEPPAVE